jgi:SAM-dependent methyltransferase
MEMKAMLGRIRRMVSAATQAAKYTPAAYRAIARGNEPGTGPKDWFSGIDDEAWFWMNTAGVRMHAELGHLVAKMPDASMQANYTGSSGDSTLREGFEAYRVIKRYYEAYVGPMRNCRGLLDFGCGWGRIIRFFLKDVPASKLVGVDHSEEGIRACKRTNSWCSFELIDPNPPTPMAPGSVDLIYLYSVFSHLPEEMHWALLEEFHRLLLPGGVLIATTRARDFIEFCKTVRDDPQLQEKPDWHRGLAKVFVNVDDALADYDSGKFCYESHHVEGRWSFWGEACIPKAYVQRRWPEILELCDYIDDREVCVQNVIVARKRPD